MRPLFHQRPAQESQGVHVVLEPVQAEQEGPAIEGFDGRVVGLNAGPVDAAVVVRFHRRLVSAMLSTQSIGRRGVAGILRAVRPRWRRHSSGSANVTIMLLPIGASSSDA